MTNDRLFSTRMVELNENTRMTLRYYIREFTTGTNTTYGVKIEKYLQKTDYDMELTEENATPGLCQSPALTEKLLLRLSEGTVTPMALHEIIEENICWLRGDHQCAAKNLQAI